MHKKNVRKPDVLTSGQVATVCGVAPRTASKWIDSGALKGYRIPESRDRRVYRRDLIEFMRANGMSVADAMPSALVLFVGWAAGSALDAGTGYEVATAFTAFGAGVFLASTEPAAVVVNVDVFGVVDSCAIAQSVCAANSDAVVVAFGCRDSVSDPRVGARFAASASGPADLPFAVRVAIDSMKSKPK